MHFKASMLKQSVRSSIRDNPAFIKKGSDYLNIPTSPEGGAEIKGGTHRK